MAVSEDIPFLLFTACRAELSGLKERAREMLLAQGAELSRYVSKNICCSMTCLFYIFV
jgi:hypothetical protein